MHVADNLAGCLFVLATRTVLFEFFDPSLQGDDLGLLGSQLSLKLGVVIGELELFFLECCDLLLSVLQRILQIVFG